MNCPGSVALLEQIPRKPTSKYAAEGTVAHSVAEDILKWGVPTVLPKDNGRVGQVIPQDGYEIEITVDMIAGATLYAQTIFNDFKALGIEDKTLKANDAKMTSQRIDTKSFLHVEESFNLKSIDEELFGTCDACICVPMKKLIVYDYKYGAGVAVDPEENPQLMYYALGVAESLGGLDSLMLEEIELVIVQPRAKHDDGPVRRWATTPERLFDFGKELKAALIDARQPNAPCVAGSWCKFCDAKTICTAVRDEVNRIAQMEFAPVDLDNKLATRYEQTQPPNVSEMKPEQIAYVLDRAPMVKDWITEVENKALELLKMGASVPGYKCVAKRANRAWADEDAVIESFEGLYGDEIYTERKLKSPAQLEKIVGKDSVKPLVVIPDAGYTVAKESDRRPAVVPAIEDFDVVLDL